VSSEFDRGMRGEPPPDITGDPYASAEHARGVDFAQTMAARNARNLQRTREAARRDFSQGYGHAFKSLLIQTILATSGIALVAALIRWRLHGDTRAVEETAAGAGGLVLVFCLLFSIVAFSAYTLARYGKVLIPVAMLGAGIFFGGRYAGAW
jgi:hypothetical protein